MVDKLWKAGYLDRYIRAAGPSTAQEIPPGEPVRGVIKVIHGSCSHPRTDSRRKKRKLAQTAVVNEREAQHAPAAGNQDLPIDAPISFPPLDGQRVVTPHDDALVLTLNIGQFDVRRILVDPGSSANLIQASALQQMGYSISNLKDPGRILSGFNGATTQSLGDIVLPVRAGPVMLKVKFSVMDDLKPYNVILGRTWLHSMKVLPSSYHQMISYVMTASQVNLLGNQSASRQCYQVAIKAQPALTTNETDTPNK